MIGTTTQGQCAIHKFALPIDENPPPLAVPLCAGILHVAQQALAGQPLSIWFAVPVDARGAPIPTSDRRRFEVHGTGHHVAGNRVHVATVLDGPFVWHVFEDRSRGGA